MMGAGMKALFSILRHLATFAAGLGAAAAANPADLFSPEALGSGAGAAALVRILPLVVSGMSARRGAPIAETAGRACMIALLVGTAAFLVGVPSCSPAGGLPPVRLSYEEDGARVEYTTAKGVLVRVDRRRGK